MNEVLKEMKKRSIFGVMPLVIIFAVLGVGLCLINGAAVPQMFDMLIGGKNLEDIAPDGLYDTFANGELDIVYDCFAEYETGSGQLYDYYVIPFGEESFIGVCVDEEKAAELDSICDATWEYLMGDSDTLDQTVSVKGNIRLMDGEELYYYKDWFQEMGYSDEEIEEYALSYVLVDGKFANDVSPLRLYLMGAGSALCFILAIYWLVKGFSGGYLKEIKQDFAQLGAYAENQIATDYQTAYVINKDVRIGRLFTYNAATLPPRAYLNQNMAWAYQYRTKRYTNGIYTGSSYNVMIFPANGSETMGDIPIKKKASEKILEYYANNFHHMVVGYSEELRDLYNKDRNAFLALRYMQAQPPVQNDRFDTAQNDAFGQTQNNTFEQN